MIWDEPDVIIIEIKCTINVVCLTHPETISLIPLPLVHGKIHFKSWLSLSVCVTLDKFLNVQSVHNNNIICFMELLWELKGDGPGFPNGSVVKNSPASARDMGLIPGQEDPTSCVATKPVCHNYWVCVLELGVTTTEAHALKAMLYDKRSHHSEKPVQYNWRVAPALQH